MFAYNYRIFVHKEFVLSVNDDHELLKKIPYVQIFYNYMQT